MHTVAETKLETCQGGLRKSNGNLSWAQVKSAHGKRRSQWTNSATTSRWPQYAVGVHLRTRRDARNGSDGQKCGTNSRTTQLVIHLKKELRTAQVTWPNPTTKKSNDTRQKTIAGALRLCDVNSLAASIALKTG